jgi:hypothetical protein
MSFFEKTNNQNKYYIYIILPRYDNIYLEKEIEIKIIVSKIIFPHNYLYIYENYKTIVSKHKNEIHDNYILTYSFNFSIPEYPYNLFIFNRITLHSYIKVCEKLKTNHKINFLCSSSYLKRIKEWGSIWKKNKYIIDKTNETIYKNIYNNILSSSSSFQDDNSKTDYDETKNLSSISPHCLLSKQLNEKRYYFEKISSIEKEDNENLFSIYKLIKYYFKIEKEEKEEKEEKYKCKILENEEIYLNFLNKRPNYDYIDKCIEYFNNDNYKIII